MMQWNQRNEAHETSHEVLLRSIIDFYLNMAAKGGLVFTLRKHRKKSIFAAGVICYGFHYATKKYRFVFLSRVLGFYISFYRLPYFFQDSS